MKLRLIAIALAVSTWTVSVQAHDPSMHKEKAEKPDCTAIKNMDHSKKDANDPVMQAMMKKCKEQMSRDDHSAHAGENHKGTTQEADER